MAEPRWLIKARSYVGQKEVKGSRHNPQILQWWTLIRAGFTDDETPWCAGFVGGVLESVGIKSSRSAWAKSYLQWGVALSKPVPGCIAVFSRGTNNGHVAFYLGEQNGNPRVLGGNQGDSVSIAVYPKERLLGYRWPSGEPLPASETTKKTKPVALVEEPPESAPDDPEPVQEDNSLSGKVKHLLNAGGTAIMSFGAALFSGDWRAVTAVVVAGTLIFCIIWFTHMRRKRK